MVNKLITKNGVIRQLDKDYMRLRLKVDNEGYYCLNYPKEYERMIVESIAFETKLLVTMYGEDVYEIKKNETSRSD